MGGEAEHLRRLRRPDLPASEVEQILGDREARRFHSVRLALAAHRNTPRAEAISLVETLFWRGLAHLSTNALVHPEVRRAADRQLQLRLPEMSLAERVDLARSVGRGALPAVRQDPDPRVLAALLDNRLAIEADVVAVAASARAGPEALSTVAGHQRWRRRPAVRDALLTNPALPGEAAEGLFTDATREELVLISERRGSSPAVRAAAERVLARRTQQD
jgi:hypothetical protein